MRRRVILVATFALLSTGCGEVETLVLPARPNLADFDQVQTALTTAGCSANGACHTALVGNFQLTPLPKAPNIRETEFQLTKQFLRLDNPDESSLLRVALRGDPESEWHIRWKD